jgi:hypothetical protein
MVMKVFLLALPWVWIAAAAFILLRPAKRARRPGAVKAFALALAAYGLSDFFVAARGMAPVWLVAWKVGCVLAMAAVLVVCLRRPRPTDKQPGRPHADPPG